MKEKDIRFGKLLLLVNGAVPLTLLLIFVLLWFSLKKLRDVLIIYTGIPLAAVGGVFALWARGIPFSVSAAVGFIALAGIAVLNGQVMIAAIRTYLDDGLPLVDAVIGGSAAEFAGPLPDRLGRFSAEDPGVHGDRLAETQAQDVP